MKLDAVQLQTALDAMFAELLPKLRDEVTDEESTNHWVSEIEYKGAELLVEYNADGNDRYFCRIQSFEQRDGQTWSTFLLSGVSPLDKCPILNWRIDDCEHLKGEALAAWLLEWAIDA